MDSSFLPPCTLVVYVQVVGRAPVCLLAVCAGDAEPGTSRISGGLLITPLVGKGGSGQNRQMET